MTGTAIDDNIINVTFTYDDTFPTWTVELGENAQVGTYSLRINDFDNDEQWNTRDITIEISA
jgi:hypothetical protein